MTLLPAEGERLAGGYHAIPLSRSVADLHAHAIVELHRAIPYASLTRQDLVAGASGRRVFRRKFDLSVVALDDVGQLAGFMLAYQRGREALHPLRSVYLHRMAVHPDHRCLGLARSIMRMYIERVPKWDPSVRHLSLQTNYEEGNRWVIEFYERLGFIRSRLIPYPQKLDILMIRAL